MPLWVGVGAAHYWGMSTAFDESDHPRRPTGEFTTKAGVNAPGRLSLESPSRFSSEEDEQVRLAHDIMVDPDGYARTHDIPTFTELGSHGWAKLIGDTYMSAGVNGRETVVHMGNATITRFQGDTSTERAYSMRLGDQSRIRHTEDFHSTLDTIEHSAGGVSERLTVDGESSIVFTSRRGEAVSRTGDGTYLVGSGETLSQSEVDERFGPQCCFHSSFDEATFDENAEFLTGSR